MKESVLSQRFGDCRRSFQMKWWIRWIRNGLDGLSRPNPTRFWKDFWYRANLHWHEYRYFPCLISALLPQLLKNMICVPNQRGNSSFPLLLPLRRRALSAAVSPELLLQFVCFRIAADNLPSSWLACVLLIFPSALCNGGKYCKPYSHFFCQKMMLGTQQNQGRWCTAN